MEQGKGAADGTEVSAAEQRPLPAGQRAFQMLKAADLDQLVQGPRPAPQP